MGVAAIVGAAPPPRASPVGARVPQATATSAIAIAQSRWNVTASRGARTPHQTESAVGRMLEWSAGGSVAATELGYEFVHAVRNTCAVSAVDWVTFDCYGTLIDWEGGIYAALAPLLPRGIDRDELGQLYIAVEAEVERGQYLKYREVLNRASRLLLERLGRPLPETKPSPVPASLPSWRPFPEVPAALRRLRAGGPRVAILSNVDRDLLATSIAQLGIAPDLAITAEDAGSYKPAHGHWQVFQRRSGASPERTVHVGASLYHDVVPATALGYRTVFVNRHGEPLDSVRPTRVLRDLAALPDVIAELAAA
ncbi:MAG: HAD family hydrolase [Chloroflexi bacterium]|nr:MAG: HAD family hydrolase [Chloroflexota bacterium]